MQTKLFLIVVVLSLFLSGCLPASSERRPATAEPTLLSTPDSSTAADSEVLTYTDSNVGFSFTYPAGWFLEAGMSGNAESSSGYSVSITSWELSAIPPQVDNKFEIPEGGTKIEISVWEEDITPEQVVERQENAQAGTVVAQSSVYLASGLTGVLIDTDGAAGLTRALIVNINGYVVYLTAYGNLQPFLNVITSLIAIK